jgi:hypothetical protein
MPRLGWQHLKFDGCRIWQNHQDSDNGDNNQAIINIMNAHTISMQFQVPQNSHLTLSDIEELKRLMPEMFGLLLERRAMLGQRQRQDLVNLLVSDVPMSAVDMKLARLQARSVVRIYKGTKWYSADEIGRQGGHGQANPGAAANRWKKNGQLFAIRRDGKDMYPRYALADDFTPLPGIRDILLAFKGWDSLRIAGWFESTSSFLGGKRPRELVMRDPQKVLLAANDAVMQLHD